MSITTQADRPRIAKVAAERAHVLRDQAAALDSEALAPLRAALNIRAGELELAAAALDETIASPVRRLQAIA